jgi:uncharacterized protein YutE (UPF0331/DUF86 family)
MEEKGRKLIGVAAKRIREVVDLLPEDPYAYLQDGATQDRVSLRLVLAVQACISLAAEIVSEEGIPAHPGLGGLFESLAEGEYIPYDIVPSLQAAARLRNRILFDFDSVNVNEIYDAARDLPEVLVDFLCHMAGVDEKGE